MPETVRGRILLVDDDEPFAAIVARHLGAHGLRTEVATSTEEACRRLATGPRFDLILLDINLPGETGWSLLRGEAYRAAGSPSVVIVSATRIPSSRLHEYGVSGYLPKPFPIDTLLETVRRHVSGEATTVIADSLEGRAEMENR